MIKNNNINLNNMIKNNNTDLNIQVLDFTIPLYGNKRLFPYYKLKVSDNYRRKIIITKEDGAIIYFIFNRKRYRIFNDGTTYQQKLRIENYIK